MTVTRRGGRMAPEQSRKTDSAVRHQWIPSVYSALGMEQTRQIASLQTVTRRRSLAVRVHALTVDEDVVSDDLDQRRSEPTFPDPSLHNVGDERPFCPAVVGAAEEDFRGDWDIHYVDRRWATERASADRARGVHVIQSQAHTRRIQRGT
jgi:hypothetical protein